VRADVSQLPTKEEQERARRLEDLQAANFLVEAVSAGGPAASGADKAPVKPFVRHVIIKDLRKVAARSKMALPSGGLFDGRAPLALLALFDGQSSADARAPGPHAAEWCCRHVHTKLIRNLISLPPNSVNTTFLKAILIKTFEDLDRELLVSQPGIQDGCGAALALLAGDQLLTAVVGRCSAIVVEPGEDGEAVGTGALHNLGKNQGRCDLPGEQSWLRQHGGVVFRTQNGELRVRSGATGVEAAVSRSLGDRALKGPSGGDPLQLGLAPEGAPTLIRCLPEVSAVQMSYEKGAPVLVLTSAPVADAVSEQTIKNTVAEFPLKPRTASGEIASLACSVLEAKGAQSTPAAASKQCTAVCAYFMAPKAAVDDVSKASGGDAQAAKRLKTDGGAVKSLRLRHILLRHRECGQPHDPVRRRDATRTQAEAEAALRRALRQLLEEQAVDRAKAKVPTNSKKAGMDSVTPSARCMSLCKEMSECSSASKGGHMCGDLGWVNEEELKGFGPSFAEVIRALGVGQWSDVVSSPHGVHLVQRIA